MTTTCFGIGIDTARYGHHVSFLDQEKRTAAKAFHFKEDHAGYQQFLDALHALCQKKPDARLHIRIDAAGQYAENLLHFLQRQPITDVSISVGKPSQNKAYRDAHYDKRKADPVESLACARFAVVEQPESTKPTPPEFVALRNAVAALEAVACDKTRAVNQLHGLLAQAFPELAVYVKDISAGFCVTLLEKYPTAKRLAAARLETIQAMPHMKPDLAKTLHEAAKVSTACAGGDVQEQLVKAKVREVTDVKRRQADLLKIVQKAWHALPAGPYRRIHSIKGIGIQTAAALLAKIVSIDRFPSSSNLVGYFGVFPQQSDSGVTSQGTPKHHSEGTMSKKGNDLVRRLLYTAAQSAVIHNPAVRSLFARQMQSDKAYNVAIGHCMAKLLRQVFAVWAKDEDFDPNFESQSQPEKETEKAVGLNSEAVKPQEKEVTTTNTKVTDKPGSGKRPPLNYVLLKSQLDILQILQSKNWTEKTRRGKQLRGPCPIHGTPGEDRVFAVNIGKHTYCCHSKDCGCKGNALDLLVALSKLPLLDAAWQWIEQTGMKPPTL